MRQSRDDIVRSYAEQDSMRARSARMRIKEKSQLRMEREREAERARAQRAGTSAEGPSARSGHQSRSIPVPPRSSKRRKPIDARGSIDSRAFNEQNKLVGYSIEESDKPSPVIDASNPKPKWKSQSRPHVSASRPFDLPIGRGSHKGRSANAGSISRSITGRRNYSNKSSVLDSIPSVVRLIVPVIVILAIILFWILH